MRTDERRTALPGRLNILAPTRYPWLFNGPRHSRHAIERREFLPFNYLSAKAEGITLFNPWPPRGFDLTHAFNRIPPGNRPFVIGFESHLPRAFGVERTIWWKWLSGMLLSDRCRGIVAISEWSKRVFLDQHARFTPGAGALAAKLHVRYPNLPLPRPPEAPPRDEDREIRLVFVGNHFARKGGCVVARMAQKAAAKGLRLSVDIVSKLEMGGGIYTDPPDPAVFAPYTALLSLPNIRVHPGLPNDQVLALLRDADMSVLATFGDTFGYSVLESLANGTPAMVTRQCALPELIVDGENGIVLDLPQNEIGEWALLTGSGRETDRYIRAWRDEVERLAEDGLAALARILETPGRLMAMRDAARVSAEPYGAEDASLWWDGFYDRAARGVAAA